MPPPKPPLRPVAKPTLQLQKPVAPPPVAPKPALQLKPKVAEPVVPAKPKISADQSQELINRLIRSSHYVRSFLHSWSAEFALDEMRELGDKLRQISASFRQQALQLCREAHAAGHKQVRVPLLPITQYESFLTSLVSNAMTMKEAHDYSLQTFVDKSGPLEEQFSSYRHAALSIARLVEETWPGDHKERLEGVKRHLSK